MREFYTILGIETGASASDVRRAYRKLARKYHPDINPGNTAAAERFSRIAEAYEVLCHPRKRDYYDTHGYYDEGALQEKPERRLGFSFEGFAASESEKPGFSELFEDFFAEVRSRRQPPVSIDIEAQVSLTFHESMRGVRAAVPVFRRRACDDCRGLGRRPRARAYACPTCTGSGEIVRSRGRLRFAMTCPECEGGGRLAPACASCRGEGRRASSERAEVDIPAGVASGSRVRYPGRGDTDPGTGRTGDLIVATHVDDDPFFQRVGDNVHCTVPVSVSEASLGARIEVPGLDGALTLKVPPGTQSGQKLRLRGRGAPSLRDSEARGDLYVAIQVVIPRALDERSKEILRELGDLNAVDRERKRARGR